MLDNKNILVSPKHTQDLKILILQNSDDNYCTASRDWSSVILKCHKNTELIRYLELYNKLGDIAFMYYLIKKIKNEKFNVVYFDSPISKLISLNQIKEIRKNCFVVVALDDNALFFQDWFRYTVQAVDLVLTHDYVEKYRYKLYGVDALFIPQVSDLETIFSSKFNYSKKNIFTSHVGRIDRIGRKEYIDEILKAGIKIENYGPGTPGGFINAKKKIDVFQRSLIGLNFSGSAEFFHGNHIQKIEKNIKQVKGRLWELALCKCLVMTEYAPCLENSFDLDREIVVFDNPKDLRDKLSYFKKNPNEIKKIALNGFQRARKDLNPYHTVNFILSYINISLLKKRLNSNKLITDPIFDKLTVIERSVQSLNMLQKLQLSLAFEQFKIVIIYNPRLIIFFIYNLIKEFFRRQLKKSNFAVSIIRKIKTLKKE